MGMGTWKDGTRIVDWNTMDEVVTIGDSGRVVQFSSDGEWLVTGGAAHFDLWDAENWRKQARIPRQAVGTQSGMAQFTPDSQTLVVSRSADLIQLISVETGQATLDLGGLGGGNLNGLTVSRDGNFIAATTRQGGVEIWDLNSLESSLDELGLGEFQMASMGGGALELPFLTKPRSTLSPKQTFFIVAIGISLIILLSAFTLNRHRGLLKDYLRVDALVQKRDKALSLAHAETGHNQKMKALGTLAAGMAHDFNNLLSVIRMSNQLTLEQSSKDPEIQENLEMIEKSVTEGKTIVRSILGYSRQPSQQSGATLEELIDSTVVLLGKPFLSGIELSVEIDDQLPPIHLPSSRIQQILLNLVVNAAEAMDGRGHLRITLKRESFDYAGRWVLRPPVSKESLQLEIKDSGPGIPNSILDRVFEPFFSTKAAGAEHGTGLGLSTVYTIAEEESLGIRVDSQIGSGTTFIIIIPIHHPSSHGRAS